MKKMIIALVLMLLLVSCEKDAIQIGVVTTLSGNNSDIGVAIRDGFLMKINEVNENGGINGHPIELVIKDDKGDLELTHQLTQELIDQGITILFGYEISSKKDAIDMYFDSEDLIFISPTMSSYVLSDIDDSFFRLIPTNYQQGQALGDYANQFSEKTLIMYSMVNENFANGVNEGYEEAFEGQVLIKGIDQDILEMEDQILKWYEGMDSIMLVMNPNDTLLMSQVLFRNNIDTNIYSSNWGMAANAYQTGGKSIEGTVFASLLGDVSYKPYNAFVDRFKSKYNEEPSFATIYAYESGILLVEALSKSNDFTAPVIKKHLLSLDTIEGVISDLKLNEFGDIQRSNLIVKLVEGEFIYQK